MRRRRGLRRGINFIITVVVVIIFIVIKINIVIVLYILVVIVVFVLYVGERCSLAHAMGSHKGEPCGAEYLLPRAKSVVETGKVWKKGMEGKSGWG